jgi:phage terminase small subunit
MNNQELYNFIDAMNAWHEQINSHLYNIAEQQKDVADALSDVKTAMIETVQDKVNELKEKIANHDCHLSQDSGCECVDWKLELKRAEETLNKL